MKKFRPLGLGILFALFSMLSIPAATADIGIVDYEVSPLAATVLVEQAPTLMLKSSADLKPINSTIDAERLRATDLSRVLRNSEFSLTAYSTSTLTGVTLAAVRLQRWRSVIHS